MCFPILGHPVFLLPSFFFFFGLAQRLFWARALKGEERREKWATAAARSPPPPPFCFQNTGVCPHWCCCSPLSLVVSWRGPWQHSAVVGCSLGCFCNSCCAEDATPAAAGFLFREPAVVAVFFVSGGGSSQDTFSVSPGDDLLVKAFSKSSVCP